MKTQFVLTFLQHYLDWVEAGAPNDNPHGLDVDYALCDNLMYYFYKIPYTEKFITGNIEFDVRQIVKELASMFARDGLNKTYPFGEEEFEIDDEMRTHHLNINRINWVRKQLGVV